MLKNKAKTRTLRLSRETVRTLSRTDLARAAGGFSGTPDCDCSLGTCTFLCPLDPV